VAFVSNRNGRRGIWLVSAAGGAPRQLIETDVIDYVTWAPDNRRVAYATAGGDAAHLWIAGVDGGAPVSLPSTNARVPAWSPVADQVAFVSLIADKPYVHVVTADGRPVREPISIDPVSLPTAIAWSPDGSRLALVNLPGPTAAEAWILDVAIRVRSVAAAVEVARYFFRPPTR
jgi:Tol biopolymer transport system component